MKKKIIALAATALSAATLIHVHSTDASAAVTSCPEGYACVYQDRYFADSRMDYRERTSAARWTELDNDDSSIHNYTNWQFMVYANRSWTPGNSALCTQPNGQRASYTTQNDKGDSSKFNTGTSLFSC